MPTITGTPHEAIVAAIAESIGATSRQAWEKGNCWLYQLRIAHTQFGWKGVSLIAEDDRMVLEGLWPFCLNQAYNGGITISFSINRPTKAIVRDIQRRFLGTYLTQWDAETERARADMKSGKELIKFINQCENTGTVRMIRKDTNKLQFLSGTGVWGFIDIRSGNSARMVIDLDKDQLLKMLAVIKTFS